MKDTSIIDLSNHRLNKAKEAVRQAELLLKNAGYDGSVNRSYYAIFNAIRSLLALLCEMKNALRDRIISLLAFIL